MYIYLGAQQQLKLPPNNEKPPQRLVFSRCGGFSLLAAGFNPAEKFAPILIYTQRKRSVTNLQVTTSAIVDFHTDIGLTNQLYAGDNMHILGTDSGTSQLRALVLAK